MLNYSILENKPIAERDNQKFYDLLGKTFSMDSLSNATVCVVNKNYVARPDLISLAMYGDDKYGDIICKLNGISNPFELNEGDVLIIPSIEDVQSCIIANTDESDFIEEDDETIEVKSNTYRKYNNESRSPNEQTINDRNYVIDKTLGIVFY